MASDVDEDKGHSQYCLKLSFTPHEHPLQDFPEGYSLVRALYDEIREDDVIINHVSVLENVEMSQSKKITTILKNGTELLQTENLESEKEKEKETVEAVAESSCELDSRNKQLQADKLKSEKLEEADKPVTESSFEPDSRSEQLQAEKLNSEKGKETDKSVGETSCELFRRDEQFQDAELKSEQEEKLIKTVSESNCDSERSIEQRTTCSSKQT
ncbi:Hypothetical predicted protein [Mytilus galloprovincialis]|uniref:Uncharacterized protein n=1 Tax=Mytilus galloprovincialis TaxID=29158 RepID=A0A8B6CXU5_MYTGA|nr:Hypothetical predicted protein [Mytilus galloprovincialis]